MCWTSELIFTLQFRQVPRCICDLCGSIKVPHSHPFPHGQQLGSNVSRTRHQSSHFLWITSTQNAVKGAWKGSRRCYIKKNKSKSSELYSMFAILQCHALKVLWWSHSLKNFMPPLLLESWFKTEAGGGICCDVVRVSPLFQHCEFISHFCDIHQIMIISIFLTPFYHFHPTLRLKFRVDLRWCQMNSIDSIVDTEDKYSVDIWTHL